MPKIVTSGTTTAPLSDEIILFNGKNFNNWVMSKDDQPCQRKVYNGKMINIETPTYSNDQCGSIYKQAGSIASASNTAGKWKTYDI